MTALPILHLVLVALWGGVVLAELVVEVVSLREPGMDRAAVVIHYWIDVLVEVPLLIGVLATGALLAVRTPWDLALAAKVGCALVAIGANTWCVGVVVRRARTADIALRSKVFASASLGVPFGLVALVLGLSR